MESAEIVARAPAKSARLAAGPPGCDGWRPLFGSFQTAEFRFEWHDFESQASVDWSGRTQTGSVEICMNLGGRAVLESAGVAWHLSPLTVALYSQGVPTLPIQRLPGERHRFICVALSRAFLALHLAGREAQLHPLVRAALRDEAGSSAVAAVERLSGDLLRLVDGLRHPPVFAPAQAVWFEAKALEMASWLLFRPPEGELLCTRAQRAACERVERARQILTERLGEPPSLEDLGRLVGCSPFYLSRCFTQQMGMTLQQYLRQVRLRRAAELLQTGRCNVTEAALEVGYNSISHFSKAFREMFGCRPGRYGPRALAEEGSVGAHGLSECAGSRA
jgi:AraC-like DNA-binding protein